jgi:uncharacterized membrane protein
MKFNFKTVAIVVIVAVVLILTIYFTQPSNELKGLPVSEFEKKIIEISENGETEKIKVHFSKWFDPYKSLNKTNFPKISNKHGVYFIRKKTTAEIVYIGFSRSNLYKALYRHFQWYNDSGSRDGRQRRTYYDNPTKYEVMICVCAQKHAARLEKHYIFEYRPKDCEFKYDYYFENLNPQSNLKEPNDFDFWDDIKSEVEVPF